MLLLLLLLLVVVVVVVVVVVAAAAAAAAVVVAAAVAAAVVVAAAATAAVEEAEIVEVGAKANKQKNLESSCLEIVHIYIARGIFFCTLQKECGRSDLFFIIIIVML